MNPALLNMGFMKARDRKPHVKSLSPTDASSEKLTEKTLEPSLNE